MVKHSNNIMLQIGSMLIDASSTNILDEIKEVIPCLKKYTEIYLSWSEMKEGKWIFYKWKFVIDANNSFTSFENPLT